MWWKRENPRKIFSFSFCLLILWVADFLNICLGRLALVTPGQKNLFFLFVCYHRNTSLPQCPPGATLVTSSNRKLKWIQNLQVFAYSFQILVVHPIILCHPSNATTFVKFSFYFVEFCWREHQPSGLCVHPNREAFKYRVSQKLGNRHVLVFVALWKQ